MSVVSLPYLTTVQTITRFSAAVMMPFSMDIFAATSTNSTALFFVQQQLEKNQQEV